MCEGNRYRYKGVLWGDVCGKRTVILIVMVVIQIYACVKITWKHTHSSTQNDYVQNQQNQNKLCGWYQYQISDFDIVLESCNEYYQ